MTDNITPAIQLDHGKPLSSEDFQKVLYEYFEDRGILSDLRAHLRSQMIKALKDTSMGNDLMNKNRDISPKLQALNLLIAEYLLQRDYHYSLSVFSTEVPLNNVFPVLSDKQRDLVKFKFSENDMWDILETLGFLQSNPNGMTISSIYKTNSKESLLNCIIKTTNIVQPEMQQEVDYTKHLIIDGNYDGSLDDFIVLIKDARLQPEITIKIIDQLKMIITNEMTRMHESKIEDITNIKKKMELEANRKLDKYKKKMNAMETGFSKERKRLEQELESAKGNLRECAQSLQAKYKEISGMEETLKTREKQLINQAELLTEKEKLLQKQLEDVVTERMNFREMQNKLERKSVQFEQPKQKETEERGQQTFENINLENVLLKHNAKHLQQQIDTLQEQNMSYLNRIQELATKTSTLMEQLETSQQRLHEMNNEQKRTGAITPLIVPSVPIVGFRTNYGIASYSGGGEEGNNMPPMAGRHFKNLAFNKDQKRRKLQYQLQNSSSSEDLSPTDTILKEAKERLHNLEKESDQIDKHYDICTSKTFPAEKSNILQDFHHNLECIRKSISRIFSRDSCYSEPGTSALITKSNVSFHTALNSEVDKIDVIKIKNLIAELPDNFRGRDYEEVINHLGVQENVLSGPSANSSGVQLATSFSTVELSTDYKTDESPRLKVKSNGGNGRRPSGTILDNVALSCLFAFVLEMYLLR